MDYPHQPDHVTLVITHRLLAGKQPEYEQWLEKIMPQAALFTGHLGVNVLKPVHGERTFTILIRFDGLDNLYHWIHSTRRYELTAELSTMLCGPEHIEMRPGAAFWFTPPTPTDPAPKKWKQFVITLAVIFPSTNLVPWFWETVLPAAGGTLWGHFLNDATVVALVVYLWMPALTRLLTNWLSPRGKSEPESNNE